MRKALFGLAVLWAGLLWGAATEIKLDVEYDTPFNYVRITQLNDSTYNPWKDGIYLGYGSSEGSVSLISTPLYRADDYFWGNVPIEDLETRSGYYFVMELLGENQQSYIAYSDVVDFNTLAAAVNTPHASPWTVYSAHAVPEPTSGLLLLMGGALLGLRRKRRVA